MWHYDLPIYFDPSHREGLTYEGYKFRDRNGVLGPHFSDLQRTFFIDCNGRLNPCKTKLVLFSIYGVQVLDKKNNLLYSSDTDLCKIVKDRRYQIDKYSVRWIDDDVLVFGLNILRLVLRKDHEAFDGIFLVRLIFKS